MKKTAQASKKKLALCSFTVPMRSKKIFYAALWDDLKTNATALKEIRSRAPISVKNQINSLSRPNVTSNTGTYRYATAERALVNKYFPGKFSRLTLDLDKRPNVRKLQSLLDSCAPCLMLMKKSTLKGYHATIYTKPFTKQHIFQIRALWDDPNRLAMDRLGRPAKNVLWSMKTKHACTARRN